MRIIVTGGAGFIGSALVRHLVLRSEHEVLNIDRLGYSSSLAAVAPVAADPRYHFLQADIADPDATRGAFREFRPDAVMHLAAESHVDRSIDSPLPFIHSNIVGTFHLLEAARRYLAGAGAARRAAFRFHHVSTDEVYGDLDARESSNEASPYAPSSPYAASKAAADHLVRAWHRTYGLPVLVTNCSNNFGPYQHPEKLVPLMILSALAGQPLPVYGDGLQVRDWLYVDDHAEALCRVLAAGKVGETYNIGGGNQRANIDVVQLICAELDASGVARPQDVGSFSELIAFVADRPGHDRRYAIDARKIGRELGWSPREPFERRLRATVRWYVDNQAWCHDVLADTPIGRRIGLGGSP